MSREAYRMIFSDVRSINLGLGDRPITFSPGQPTLIEESWPLVCMDIWGCIGSLLPYVAIFHKNGYDIKDSYKTSESTDFVQIIYRQDK
jgi:hypothetical protein